MQRKVPGEHYYEPGTHTALRNCQGFPARGELNGMHTTFSLVTAGTFHFLPPSSKSTFEAGKAGTFPCRAKLPSAAVVHHF